MIRMVLPRQKSLKWRVVAIEGLRPTDKGVFNRLLAVEGTHLAIYAQQLYSLLIEKNIANQLDDSREMEIVIPADRLVKLKRLARRKSIRVKVRALR